MRIAFFHSDLPRAGKKPGGVAATVDRLANALVGRGHDVAFYAYADPPSGSRYELRQLGDPSEGPGRLARYTSCSFRLNRVNFGDSEVLHLHGDDWFFLRRRLPTVRTFYGAAALEAVHAAQQGRWPRAALQAMIAPLETVASALATSSYGIAPGGPRVHFGSGFLPCGVDVAPSPQRRLTPHPTILFVGTWLGRKRGRLLYEAFRDVIRPAVPHAELWMVSDWAPEGDGVRWFDAPSDEVLQGLRESAWVFCLPSSYEGFGIPYIEAMSAGLPAVATPNIGASHVGEQGRSLVIADPADLGAVITELLGNEARRAALSREGRRRAADFDWDAVVTSHELAYTKAIERWTSRGVADPAGIRP